jgi:hypothetical protein
MNALFSLIFAVLIVFGVNTASLSQVSVPPAPTQEHSYTIHKEFDMGDGYVGRLITRDDKKKAILVKFPPFSTIEEFNKCIAVSIVKIYGPDEFARSDVKAELIDGKNTLVVTGETIKLFILPIINNSADADIIGIEIIPQNKNISS